MAKNINGINHSPGNIDRLFIITGVILAILMLAAVFGIPLLTGDLFTALASGRDSMAWEWNSPDTWAFSTGNSTWVNQNWGASVLLYLAEQYFGGTGLLAVKFTLLALCLLFLILAMLERKIPPVIALFVAAAVTGGLNVYTVLRPNLFTLMFLCLELWLLERTFSRPRTVWLVVPVIAVWANIHGGFIFGLGLLCLFCGCIMIPEIIKNPGHAWKKQWHFPAAILAGFLLAGLANPFGFTNLTFPFRMMHAGVWHTVRDWLPVCETNQLSFFMSGIIAFFITGGIIFILSGIRLACHFFCKNSKIPWREIMETGEWKLILFEAGTAIGTGIMAVCSNRFIAIALPVLAIPLACQLKWVFDFTRLRRILPAVLQGCLLLFCIVITRDNLLNYHPANPLLNTGPGTLFERMHYVNKNYNSKLIQFINSNHITGNVFNPWLWEGFLRWNCPQLKVFIGGRAQQVYSEEAFHWYQYLTGNKVPSMANADPVQLLRAIKADILITSHSDASSDLIYTALSTGCWIIIYADERDLLFANTSRPLGTELAARFTSGKLTFPDTAREAISSAAFYFSQPEKWDSVHLLDLFAKAWEYNPAWLWSYKMLYSNLRYEPALFGKVIHLLEKRLTSLESLPLDDAGAAGLLRCRIFLGEELSKIAGQLNQEEEARENEESHATAMELYTHLKKRWKQWLINGWS